MVRTAMLAMTLLTSVAAGRNRARTVPELEPASHNTFFGKDYPHDIQPTAKLAKDFSHPYPEMQDDSTYDKDYVKDENDDGGEWKAQTEYDHLRTKLVRQKAEAERSKEYRKELQKKLETAKDEEKKAETSATDQEKRLKDIEEKKEAEAAAEKKAEKAAEDLEKAKAAENKGAAKTDKKNENKKEAKDDSVADKTSGGVDKAANKVEKEIKDVDGCKKALEEAQAALNKLQEERIAAEKADQKANALEAEKLQAEEAAKKNEAAASDALKVAQDEYSEKKDKADAEAAALAKMEREMGSAEDTLHKLRHSSRSNGGVDSGGGVYRTARSAAYHNGAATLMSLLLAAVLFC